VADIFDSPAKPGFTFRANRLVRIGLNNITHIISVRYEGPIYRPPSEANSLLIQATIGCPHNRCTFCMIYKNSPGFRIRKLEEIKEDLLKAREVHGSGIQTLFFPDGNTIAMKTEQLSELCRFSREVFPELQRITVYGSSQYIHQRGPEAMKQLAEAGLNRIHVGLESGDDVVLKRIKKGTDSQQQITAGQWVIAAGMELSLYVILGIGGRDRTKEHASETARVLNEIGPNFIRIRTFIPKTNTPLLEDVESGLFQMLGAHGVLDETAALVKGIEVSSYLASDHYSNYINLEGRLPQDKEHLLASIRKARLRKESAFRPFFVGTE
jgi:radical SAM superfamily enzyme YgiQ (UPF0313 family)